jgi:hypothetical protein
MPVATYALKLQAAKTDVFAIVPKSARRIKSVTVSVSDASATTDELIVLKRRPSGGGGDVTLSGTVAGDDGLDLSKITADTPTAMVLVADTHLVAGDMLVAVVSAAGADAADDIVMRVEW